MPQYKPDTENVLQFVSKSILVPHLSERSRLYLKRILTNSPTPVRSLRESRAFFENPKKFRDFTRGLPISFFRIHLLRSYHWVRSFSVFLAIPFGSGVVAKVLGDSRTL